MPINNNNTKEMITAKMLDNPVQFCPRNFVYIKPIKAKVPTICPIQKYIRSTVFLDIRSIHLLCNNPTTGKTANLAIIPATIPASRLYPNDLK